MPYQELVEEAEGILALMIARWDRGGSTGFDGSKAGPTSWIYRGLYWDLQIYCDRKRPKERNFSTLGTEENPISLAQKTGWLEGLLSQLGEDARILVTTILFAPSDIAKDIVPNPRSSRRGREAVVSYLRGQGWGLERITSAWSEVEVAL